MSGLDIDDAYKDLYQKYFSTTPTTLRPWFFNPEEEEEVELDDTAPLPLLIGIGLALFIGFVILVLICCCCRRRRPPQSAHPANPAAPPLSQASYQRAPLNDGGGMAYPMTAVPPQTGYPPPNPTMGYQSPPPHLVGPNIQRNFGVIGSGPGMTYPAVSGKNHQFPQQQPAPPPHFGGVPTFPPNQYLPPPTSLAVSVDGAGGPMLHHLYHQSPPLPASISHSSQASTSSASGATADPLVPSTTSASAAFSHHHQQPQNFYLQNQQQQQYLLQQQQQQYSPMVHQLVQQQHSGRDSPAGMFHPSYSHMNNSNSGGSNIPASSSQFYHPGPAPTLPSAPQLPQPPLPPPASSSSPLSSPNQPLPPSSLAAHDTKDLPATAGMSTSTMSARSSSGVSEEHSNPSQPFLASERLPSSRSNTDGEEEEEE